MTAPDRPPTHGHAPEPTIAAITAAVAVVVTLAGFGGTYSYVWAPVAVLLYAVAAWLGWRALFGHRVLPANPILLPVAGFGCFVVAQWWWGWSLAPDAGLTEILQMAACGCVLILGLVAFQRASLLRRWGQAAWWLTGLVSMEALLQFFFSRSLIYGFHDASYATPMGPFVYHNHYAGAMDLLLPLAWAVALIAWPSGGAPVAGRIRRAIFPLLGVLSVIVAASRGGALTLVAEFVLGMWFFRRSLGRKRALQWLGAGLVALALAGWLAGSSPLMRRFQMIQHDPSVLERGRVARAALNMFADRPWKGDGLDSFRWVYPHYQNFDSGLNWDHAHNEYVQILAETGVVGAACVLAFLILLVLACRRVERQPDGVERTLQLAAGVGALGFLLHSWGDFLFHSPADALLFFLLAAAVSAHPVREHHRRRRRSARRWIDEEPVLTSLPHANPSRL